METGWQALASKVREGFLVPKEYRPIAFVENEETGEQDFAYARHK